MTIRAALAIVLTAIAIPWAAVRAAQAQTANGGPQGASQPSILQLSIGDPERRDRTVDVTIDAIVDTRSGAIIDPDVLADAVGNVRLLLVGESHTSAEAHRVQLQVLRALHRHGRRVLIGLEMFPVTAQPALDAWNAGQLSEAEFIARSRWHEHWGYDWRYYRDIFVFARDNGIPVHAINLPRDVVSAVRQKGIGNLPPEQAAYLPPRVDVDDPDHLAFFKASIGPEAAAHGMTGDDAWKGMLAAQATWDAAMGWNMLQVLERLADPRALGVVLVGTGHVAYGVGIERQARAWTDAAIASVIPVAVEDEDGPVGPVRASYAHYIWGVPRERWSAYPSLGVATVAAEGGRRIVHVDDDSPAAAAALRVGDVVLSVDGRPTATREALSQASGEWLWGDVARVRIRRDGESQDVNVPLRRRLAP